MSNPNTPEGVRDHCLVLRRRFDEAEQDLDQQDKILALVVERGGPADVVESMTTRIREHRSTNALLRAENEKNLVIAERLIELSKLVGNEKNLVIVERLIELSKLVGLS